MKTKHYLPVLAGLVFSTTVTFGQSWGITGNSGTSPSSNFLGTSDANGLSINTNSSRALIVTADQKVGIGHVDAASTPPFSPPNTFLIQNGLNVDMWTGAPSRYTDGIAVWATSTQSVSEGFNTAFMGMSTDDESKNVGGFFQSWGNSAVNVGVVGSSTGSNNNLYPGGGGLDVPEVTVNIGVRGMADGANSLNIGLEAQVSNPESGNSDINYGARCNVSTTSADANYGVFGNLYQAGGTINYAIWGLAPSGAGSSHQDTLVDGSNGTASYAGYFTGDVFCSNVYYYSDAKLKENIREYSGAMDQLRKLNIKQYTFKNKEFPQLNMPDGLQVGVLSNEMKAVFPDLVKYSISPDPQTGRKDVEFEAVNYNALIPVLVQAVKEMDSQLEENEALRKKVEEQEKTMQTMAAQLEQLANCVNELCSAKFPGTSTPTDSRLYPCVPNPTSADTRVDYFIGTSFTRATLQIIDPSGRKKEEHRLSNGGNGSLTLNTQTWPSGTYTYSLVIDGKIIDSKTLVVNH